jgi:hypothetical protein
MLALLVTVEAQLPFETVSAFATSHIEYSTPVGLLGMLPIILLYGATFTGS